MKYITLRMLEEKEFEKTLGITKEAYNQLLKGLSEQAIHDFKSNNFRLKIPERLMVALEYFLDPFSYTKIGQGYGIRKEGVLYSVRWVCRYLSKDIDMNLSQNLVHNEANDFYTSNNYKAMSQISIEDFEKQVGFPKLKFDMILRIFICSMQIYSKTQKCHIYIKKSSITKGRVIKHET